MPSVLLDPAITARVVTVDVVLLTADTTHGETFYPETVRARFQTLLPARLAVLLARSRSSLRRYRRASQMRGCRSRTRRHRFSTGIGRLPDRAHLFSPPHRYAPLPNSPPC